VPPVEAQSLWLPRGHRSVGYTLMLGGAALGAVGFDHWGALVGLVIGWFSGYLLRLSLAQREREQRMSVSPWRGLVATRGSIVAMAILLPWIYGMP
jgi:membrane associated rhomboid family serine protease